MNASTYCRAPIGAVLVVLAALAVACDWTPGSGDSQGWRESSPAIDGVSILLDNQQYQAGAEIKVTIRNELPEAVVVPGEGSDCVITVLQKQDSGGWSRLPCVAPSGVFSPYFIPPDGSLTGFVGVAQPVIGGPFDSGEFDDDLRTLPTEPPAPPRRATEVPQGILPTDVPSTDGSAPFSVLDSPLRAGVYRIEVVVKAPSGQLTSVLSDEFTILD